MPKLLRKEMVDQIHSSHIGTEGCLRRARESLYWPSMSAEIRMKFPVVTFAARVITDNKRTRGASVCT